MATPGQQGETAHTLREGALQAVQRLHGAGFTAFWAGGCVRDQVMGRAPSDYDIATNARPERVEALFSGSVTVGKSFGVVRAPVGEHFYEIATFRSERGYRDGRRPSEVRFVDPQTDAARRDFTINALFYDPLTDTVHDYVGGRDDIQRRLVRCVGDPSERFAEDHLRLLRAVRFSVSLNFALESATRDAIRAHASLCAKVAPERIRQELTRMLVEAVRAGDVLRLLDETGLLEVILPEVAALKGQEQPPEFHPEGDVFTHTVGMLDRMKDRDPQLAYAVLLHDIGKPLTACVHTDRVRFNGHASQGARVAEELLRRLRFSAEDIRVITHCIRNHMRFMDVRRMRDAKVRRLVGSPTFPIELELHRLDCLASHGDLANVAFLEQFREKLAAEPVLPEPWVSGHDILQMGVPEGPAVGRWRREAYDAQLDGRCRDRDELLAWLRSRMEASGS